MFAGYKKSRSASLFLSLSPSRLASHHGRDYARRRMLRLVVVHDAPRSGARAARDQLVRGDAPGARARRRVVGDIRRGVHPSPGRAPRHGRGAPAGRSAAPRPAQGRGVGAVDDADRPVRAPRRRTRVAAVPRRRGLEHGGIHGGRGILLPLRTCTALRRWSRSVLDRRMNDWSLHKTYVLDKLQLVIIMAYKLATTTVDVCVFSTSI
jgi:hypothetical protein